MGESRRPGQIRAQRERQDRDDDRRHTRIFAPYQDMSLTGESAGVTQNDLPALSAASGIKHFTMAFISS